MINWKKLCIKWLLVFLTAENENRPPVNLPQTDFGRELERFLLLVTTKSINEDFLCFGMFERIFFICSLDPNAVYYFYLGIVDPFILIH